MTKIYIIAGEASGDVLGAKLIKALKKSNNKIQIFGIGGEKMTTEGLHSLFPISDISLMGFAEILPHIPNLLKRISQTIDNILETKPDVIVTIDSPGFNTRIAKKLKHCSIPLVHYVAPTVWAYKEKRAEKFAKLFDHILLLLPFEPPYFNKVKLDNTFIGHPIIENEIDLNGGKSFRKKHGIKQSDKLICLLPGSRKSEITNHLSIFINAINKIVKKYPNIYVVIPALENLKPMIEEKITKLNVSAILVDPQKEKWQAFTASNLALAKSGTGALELSLAKVPTIVTYKTSIFTYAIIKTLIKVKFINLVNLILDKDVIPELIQNNCNADILATKIEIFLKNPQMGEKQIKQAEKAIAQLGSPKSPTPSEKAAKVVLKYANLNN